MSADHRTVAVGRTLPDPDDAHLLARPFTRVVRIDDASFYATCNVFYRRADLDLVGGFDEAFATPAGEDTDLGLRVSEAGRTTVFVPDAVVHHPVRPSSFRATVRETVRWVGIPRVIARHPAARSLLVHRLFWKRSHPPTLFAVLGVLLVLRRRRAAVLLLPWLWHRLVTAPPCPGPRRRVLALPGTFAVDALEVAVMVRGSVRERTLVL